MFSFAVVSDVFADDVYHCKFVLVCSFSQNKPKGEIVISMFFGVGIYFAKTIVAARC